MCIFQGGQVVHEDGTGTLDSVCNYSTGFILFIITWVALKATNTWRVYIQRCGWKAWKFSSKPGNFPPWPSDSNSCPNKNNVCFDIRRHKHWTSSHSHNLPKCTKEWKHNWNLIVPCIHSQLELDHHRPCWMQPHYPFHCSRCIAQKFWCAVTCSFTHTKSLFVVTGWPWNQLPLYSCEVLFWILPCKFSSRQQFLKAWNHNEWCQENEMKTSQCLM
jgi:hypothetical protein